MEVLIIIIITTGYIRFFHVFCNMGLGWTKWWQMVQMVQMVAKKNNTDALMQMVAKKNNTVLFFFFSPSFLLQLLLL